MSVVYTTINGRLIHQVKGGQVTKFVSDTLGSVIAEIDNSGQIAHTADYWPYGEVRTETGAKQSPFGFVGVLGYMKDFADALYVRARYLRTKVARWQTVDPLWPFEPPFAYGYCSPKLFNDATGYVAVAVAGIGGAAGFTVGLIAGAGLALGAPAIIGAVVVIGVGVGGYLLIRSLRDRNVTRDQTRDIDRCLEPRGLPIVRDVPITRTAPPPRLERDCQSMKEKCEDKGRGKPPGTFDPVCLYCYWRCLGNGMHIWTTDPQCRFEEWWPKRN